MPWTHRDTANIRRVVAKYRTATEAASALGLTRSTLSRYLSADRKPHGSFAETALRERIERLLRREKENGKSYSANNAEP